MSAFQIPASHILPIAGTVSEANISSILLVLINSDLRKANSDSLSASTSIIKDKL